MEAKAGTIKAILLLVKWTFFLDHSMCSQVFHRTMCLYKLYPPRTPTCPGVRASTVTVLTRSNKNWALEQMYDVISPPLCQEREDPPQNVPWWTLSSHPWRGIKRTFKILFILYPELCTRLLVLWSWIQPCAWLNCILFFVVIEFVIGHEPILERMRMRGWDRNNGVAAVLGYANVLLKIIRDCGQHQRAWR